MKDINSILGKVLANKDKIINDMNSQESSFIRDTTFWNPPYDSAKKVGSATIAFLPFRDIFEDDNAPFSPYLFIPEHTDLKGTKGKKYYNILCPGVHKKPCPICEKFFELYNGSEDEKKLAQQLSLGRKRYFYSNIIVIKNPYAPDEVGKIFKYKFGVGISGKIKDKFNPVEQDEESVIINDPTNILPFKLSIKEKQGFRNFDDSQWVSNQKHLADFFINTDSLQEKNEWLIENVINKLFYIKDFVTEESYRSEEELSNIIKDILIANNVISNNEVINVKEKVANLGKEISSFKSDEDELTEKTNDSVVEEDDFDSIFKDEN